MSSILIDDNDFFNEGEQSPEVVEEVLKVKIGDEEFDPEEAQKLIQLGKIGREAEEKYNTKIDRVFPEYTKATQKLSQIEKEREEQARVQIEQKQQSGQELSAEEQKRLVREQLKGFGVFFEDDYQSRFDQDYADRRAGEKLIENVNDIVRDAEEKGIKTSNVKVLEYMQQEGIKNPKTAFELMHREQLRSWEEEQLRKSRPNGIVTESASTAGSKQPTVVRPTRDNLLDQVLESLDRGN